MNYRGLKNRARWGVSAVALTTSMALVGPAVAQVDELIVTAQKREQSVQDVPIAIAAFGAEFMEDTGVRDLFDLQFYTPGLVVENNAGPQTTEIRIRGVGTSGTNLALESSVGLYIDGVYRTRQDAATRDLIDIERVEILKGPQGTLFGRNTASGALQYITRAPEPEFGGWAEAEYGNLNYMNVKGALNVPVVEDVLLTRIAGNWQQRDGFVDNILTGEEAHDRDRYGIKGQALFTPNETVSFRLIADYSKLEEKCCISTNTLDGVGDTIALFSAAGGDATVFPPVRLPGTSFLIPLEAGQLPLWQAFIPDFANRFPGGFPVVFADQFDEDIFAFNKTNFAEVEDYGISGELNWEVNGVTITSITAFREYESFNDTDADQNAFESIKTADDVSEQTTFSQELRIAGSIGERIEYVAGAYYFRETLKNERTLEWGQDMFLQGGGALTEAQLLALGAIPGFIEPTALGLLLDADPSNDALFVPTAIANADAYCAAALSATYTPRCGSFTFPDGSLARDFFDQEQTSWAVFAQADYSITDQLIATVGLRYNDEVKETTVQFLEENGADATPVSFAVFGPTSPLVPNEDITFEDTTVTGTAKLTYFWTDEIMTYVSYGRGYKAGGTNIERISPINQAVLAQELFGVGGTGVITTDAVLAAPREFQPEVVKSWEIGMKGDFLDNRLRVNVAAYTSKFEDFQADSFLGNAFVLVNAGALSVDGVEVDVTAAPTDWLTLTLGGAWTDAVYDSFERAPCDQTPYGGGDIGLLVGSALAPAFCDKSGERVPGTPEYVFTGSARVERPVFNDVLGYGQIDFNWNDDTPFGQDADPEKARDSYALVNARIGINLGNDRLDVSLWGRNVFDEDYVVGTFNAVGREGSLTAYHTDPRTYGITVRTKF